MQVTLKLYATLTDYLPAAARSTNQVRLDVPPNATVETLIAPFNLPAKLAHLLLINGVFVPRSERNLRKLREGDVVAIWPPIAGG
ncbi:MAG TPA: MoaD/ThiS family protein [Casimicrobiaceae bacterium]|nr:MoaD/ThiS family protein [Casimicrobiaceae bacterium]